ncbi:hypothetical protein GCM10009720_09220 [Yaniella flava]|uniref:Restriction endonuclease n=1 Tax=Yaniella flava TaxID=287930 RepID=A0ABN2U8D6_9MICC|nr:hypothetical protein [Micrococcaceae bacterium]
MANPQKNKGARNERAAVEFFVEHFADLVDVKNPARLLGEGRREDGGDLNLLSDTTVQVKAWADLGAAIRSAATTVIEQADYADKPYAIGMVPVPRARKGTIEWIMCCLPDTLPAYVGEPVVSWARVTDLLTWLRDDTGPKGFQVHPRHQRIGTLSHASSADIWCFPPEVFVQALRQARTTRDTSVLQAAS